MIIKRTIRPKNKRYLPPQDLSNLEPGQPYEDCGTKAPVPPFDVLWSCTRGPGHDGDHATHTGFLGPGKPVMVARWGDGDDEEETS